MRRHIRAILAAAAILAIPMAAQANDLPIVPQAADQPRPAGTRAKLRVLDWAGMRAAVSYTFDDAQPSQSEHLDELLATGAPMTEYIVSSAMQTAPDFVSSWRKAGKAGWELGNHTGHHCPFGQACGGLARFDAASDIDAAERVITGTLKAPGVWTLAYPFGDTRWREATEPRVFLARGVQPGSVAPHGGDRYNLPVFPVAQGQVARDFDQGVDSARAQRHWLIFMFHSLRPTKADWFAGVETSDVVANVRRTQGLRDVWIGTLADVGAYWVGQQIVEAAVAKADNPDTPQTWRWAVPAHFPPGRMLRVRVDGGTLSQGGQDLPWDAHGFYTVALDAGELSWRP